MHSSPDLTSLITIESSAKITKNILPHISLQAAYKKKQSANYIRYALILYDFKNTGSYNLAMVA